MNQNKYKIPGLHIISQNKIVFVTHQALVTIHIRTIREQGCVGVRAT